MFGLLENVTGRERLLLAQEGDAFLNCCCPVCRAVIKVERGEKG